MAEFFDEQKWREAAKLPDGYLQILDDYKSLMKQADEADEDTEKKIKEEVYSFVEELLENDQFYLAGEGYDFDADRQPIDTVVIHHIGNHPGIELSRLNANGFIRLYSFYYANPIESKKHLRGKPIYSGHFRNGKQVFWAYHWFVRRDGTTERLLKDNEIGWHAGSWDMNCRSVAICLDDTLTEKEPTKEVLESAVDIINTHYKGLEVLGHREVNPKTVCPGNLFLSGWKQDLKERTA